MTFSTEQIKELQAPLDRGNVSTRKQGGRTLSYIEGWHAIAEANRIFGFDHWTRETTIIECVTDGPRKIGVTETFAGYDGFGVTYICKVRVEANGVVREGCGAGHGIDRDHGQAHESAIKEAETDAMKRALMTFGNPFGLALYDKEQANVTAAEPSRQPSTRLEAELAARERYIEACKGTIEEMADRPKMLLLWWNSEAQKAARRKYDLSPAEVEILKTLVLSKIPPKEPTDEPG